MTTKPTKLEQQLEWYMEQLQCSNESCPCKSTMKRHCPIVDGHSNGDENPSLDVAIQFGSFLNFKCWTAHSNWRPAILQRKVDELLSGASAEYSEYTNTIVDSSAEMLGQVASGLDKNTKNIFPEVPAVNRIKSSENTITGTLLSVDTYLEERKLSGEVKKAFNLKDNKTGIIMPYLDADQVEVSTRIRRDDKKIWKKGSKSHHPYGLHLLDTDADTITIVEGESDTHAVWQSRAEIGAVLGTAGNPHAIHKWDNSIWENYSTIRIAVDYGFKGYDKLDAGALKLIESANKLPAEHLAKVKLWILPKPYKDISELVTSGDTEAVSNIEEVSIAEYVNKPLLAKIEGLFYLEDKNVITHFRDVVSEIGLLPDISQMILHVLESTNSDDPLALVIKGTSGSGKNHHIEIILLFAPEDRVIKFTNASPMALFYDDESYEHKIIYKAEAGFEDPTYLKVERSLLSEKKLKLITVKDQESLKLEKAGPTGFLTTTTNTKLYHDNETRVMSITIPNDKSYLDRVKKQQLLQATQLGSGQLSPNEEFIALHKYNQMMNWEVIIAEDLAIALIESIEMTDSEQNRDLAQLIGLMKSSARLNFMYRDVAVTAEGVNVLTADIEDYKNVHILANQMVSESLGVSIPKGANNTYVVLKEMYSNRYMKTEFDDIYYSVSDIQEYFSKNETKLKELISGEKLKGKTGLNADIKTLLKAEFLEQEPKYTTTYRLRVRPINRTEIVYKNIYPTVEEINEYLSIHSIHNDNDNPSNSNRHDLPLKLYPSNPETDDLENDIQY